MKCVDCNQPIIPDANVARGWRHEAGKVTCRGGFGSAWPAPGSLPLHRSPLARPWRSQRPPRYAGHRNHDAKVLAALAAFLLGLVAVLATAPDGVAGPLGLVVLMGAVSATIIGVIRTDVGR